MKKVFFALLIGIVFTGCNKDDDELAPEVTINDVDEIIVFTDTNFKAVLINDSTINTNYDSDITHSEALNFTGIIAAQNSNIGNVEGIEFFILSLIHI